MKKGIAIWLSILLCILLALTGTAAAETSGSCGDGVTWTLSGEGVLEISGNGKITSSPWTAEDTINLVKEVRIGKGVTSICSSAFEDCSALTKVTLPDTLTTIGAYAFVNCGSLTEITVPDSTKEIGSYALGYYWNDDLLIRVSSKDTAEAVSKQNYSFRMTGLKYNQRYLYNNGTRSGLEISRVDKDVTSFSFPEGTTGIGDDAFRNCEALTTIAIPEGVTYIGYGGFWGCKALASMTLPSTLTSIGNYAFYSCSSLKSLTLPNQISDLSGSSFYGGYATLYADGDSLTAETLSKNGYYYRAQGSSYSVRKLYDNNGNQTGTELGILDNGLTTFTIPADITDIAPLAIQSSRTLMTLTVPATMTRIGSRALGSYGGTVIFKGSAPEFAEDAFSRATIVLVYPHGDDSWKAVAGKDYCATAAVWRTDNEQTQADKDKEATEELNITETDNESQQDVTYLSSKTVKSYLAENPDGTIIRVEYTGENVVVEQYSKEMKLTWKKTLNMELPIWGGFFSGSEYNFIVEGQNNDEEDDTKEVMRIIRYTKNWHRVDAAGVFGANTVHPFAWGTLAMSETGNYLYIHTCHEMYAAADGKNHQANMSYQLFVPTMKIIPVNKFTYTSHSLGQCLLIDGLDIIQVDLGDAYPRGVYLYKMKDGANTPDDVSSTSVKLLDAAQRSDGFYQQTGISLGGLAASGSRYILVGTSLDQNNIDNSSQRNVFAVSVPKTDFSESKVSMQWLTSLSEGSGRYLTTPQLVQISSSSMLVLWTEADDSYATNKTLKYVFLNENGAAASSVYSADARLSDCKPVVKDGKVIWYVTEDSGSVFYIIDPADPGNVQKAARSSWVKLNAGWYYYDENGNMATGFITVDGKTYYMDEQGLMVTGPQTVDGKHYVFDDSGAMLSEQWYAEDGIRKYYLGADGAAVTGLATVKEEKWYYNSEKGEYESGTFDVMHFFSEDGIMQTGWQSADGKYYYFDAWGDMVANSWQSETLEDGTTADYYLGEDGAMVTGLMTLNESVYVKNQETGEWDLAEVPRTYYLKPDGAKATGWQQIDGAYYCFDGDGRMRTGWYEENNTAYYLGEDGKMVTGFITVTENVYEYNRNTNGWDLVEKPCTYYLKPEDGTKATGWQLVDGTYYCFNDDGVMRTGWYEEGNAKYYLGQDGKMATGSVEIDGTVYHFTSSGAYTENPEPEGNGWVNTSAGWTYIKDDGTKATGWQLVDGTYYCFDDSGVMRTGWYEEGNATYYLGEDGAMVTGSVEIDGKVYHFTPSGAYTENPEPEGKGWTSTDAGWTYIKDDGTKATGWLSDGSAWYYMNADGIMQTGWVSDGGTWYYMKPSGEMATGWISDGGTWYYMKPSGAMATGWISDGSAWYYMKSSGAMATGWVYDGGKWYYMKSSGVMATGWTYASGSWYYFRDSGAMVTGWFEDKEAEEQLPEGQKRALWYWFDENGAMAKGWKEINGQWEMFADSGEWLYTWDGN